MLLTNLMTRMNPSVFRSVGRRRKSVAHQYFARSQVEALESRRLLTQSWTQMGADIDGEAAGDLFGGAVSVSHDGRTVAVGASLNDGDGTARGHVRVYHRQGSTWSQLGADINGEATDDQSGGSVSISGDGTTVAIGAQFNDANGASSGHVRVYRFTAGAWTQLGADIDGPTQTDELGAAVALSFEGNTVAVGSVNASTTNGAFSGNVKLYGLVSGTWTQLGGDLNGEAANDRFGHSLAMSTSTLTVAIGAPFNDGNGEDSGSVRVYRFNDGSWLKLGDDINGEASDDRSGYSVSLSNDGNTVAIGAMNNDGSGANAGHVRVYRRTDGQPWTQLGGDIDGEAAADLSGSSVSLSADGETVAIGAPFNDGSHDNAGHVRVFKLIAGVWTQVGPDIDGESATDFSGNSVAMTPDGSTVVIGAPGNDGSGSDAGHVRVFGAKLEIDPVEPFPINTPIFTWNSIAEAEHYEVWVGNVAPRNGHREFAGQSVVSTNSFIPPQGLSPGIYRIWVRILDAEGNPGAWSAFRQFEHRPRLVTPIIPTYQTRPLFTWALVRGATGYDLFLRTSAGDMEFKNLQGTQWFPDNPLPPGNIRWWIRASNMPAGKGWSLPANFNVQGMSELTSPKNTISNTKPELNWLAVTGANRYILYVAHADTGALAFRKDDLTGTTYTPTTALASGKYRVWIKAINSNPGAPNPGTWGLPMEFTIAGTTSLDANDPGYNLTTTHVQLQNRLQLLQTIDEQQAGNTTKPQQAAETSGTDNVPPATPAAIFLQERGYSRNTGTIPGLIGSVEVPAASNSELLDHVFGDERVAAQLLITERKAVRKNSLL